MNDITERVPASRVTLHPALSADNITAMHDALHYVNSHELEELRATLERGQIPRDFQAKLAKLQHAGIIHHFVHQNSQLVIALLLAAKEGAFRGLTAIDRERLLQVLAYVRRDDDLIPDYRADGYTDDYQEIRAAFRDLAPVIQTFKNWRLRHQVPVLWTVHPAESSLDKVALKELPEGKEKARRASERRWDISSASLS